MGDVGQKPIAKPAGPGLESLPLLGPILPHRQPSPLARQAELGGQPLDEPPVIGGLGPQIVLGVGHHNRHPQEPVQPDQEPHTVGTARNTHDDRKPTRTAGGQACCQGRQELLRGRNAQIAADRGGRGHG